MKKTILTTIVFMALSSKADIIKCSFTEPFINTTYSMSESTLTYDRDLSGNTKKAIKIKNVSFQIKSAGVFELTSKDGKVLQLLNLNNAGSDGMSEAVYPYDAKDNYIRVRDGLIGGCESNYLKVKENK